MDPGEGWPPVTGVISPLSTNTTVLTVFCSEEAEVPRHFLHTAVAEDPPGSARLFSDVLDVVLNQTHDLLEDPAASGKLLTKCSTPVGHSLFQHEKSFRCTVRTSHLG